MLQVVVKLLGSIQHQITLKGVAGGLWLLVHMVIGITFPIGAKLQMGNMVRMGTLYLMFLAALVVGCIQAEQIAAILQAVVVLTSRPVVASEQLMTQLD